MDLARFGVVIDPTSAHQGKAEIVADLKAILETAKATQSAVGAAMKSSADEQKAAIKAAAAEAVAAAKVASAEAITAAATAKAAAREKAAADKTAADEAKAQAKSVAAEQTRASKEAAAAEKASAAEREAADRRAGAAAKAAAREAAAVQAAAAAERQRAEQRAAAAAREAQAAQQGALARLFSEVSNGLQMVATLIPGVSGMFLTLVGTAGGAASGLGAVAASSAGLMAAIVPLLAVIAALAAAFVALGLSLVFGDRMNAAIGRINSATKDLSAARAVYDSLYQTSLRTGAAIDDSAQAFVRFSIAARGIGASHAQVLQLVETIQKAGVVGGASAGELSAATMQLGQALASGRLQGDELRSILENMPTLAEKLAVELKTSVGGLRKMGEEGRLNADILFPALLRTTAAIRKEFDAMPMTMGRGFTSLRTVVVRLFGDLDQATGFSKKLGEGFASAAMEAERLRQILVGGIRAGNLGEIIGANLKIAGAEIVNTLERAALGFVGIIATGIAVAFRTTFTVYKEMIDTILRTVEQAIIDLRNQIPNQLGGTRDTPVISAGAQAPGLIGAVTLPAMLREVNAAVAEWMHSVDTTFTPEQIEKLKAARDELAKVATEMSKTSAALDATKKVINDPTVWKGTGTAPKTDAAIMTDLQERIRFFEANRDAGLMSAKGAAFRINDARQNAVGELGDPGAAASRYPAALEAWRTFHEERRRIADEADRKIETGTATMFESFNRGLQQAADAWGNAQQQMVRLSNGVANSLTNNVSAGLTAIVTGSKDAKTAFRDMAIGILNDIARMIIQLLVELAVRQAIKAISGYAGGGAVTGNFDAGARASAGGAGAGAGSISAGASASGGDAVSNFMGGGSGSVEPPLPTGGAGGDPLIGLDPNDLGFARGGRIGGGSGAVDDVPAWLTAGEYVISKRAVDHYGTGMLDAINERRARRFAEGGRTAAAVPTRGGNSGDAFSFNINIETGSESSGGQSQGQGDEARKRKELGELIKNQCMNVIVDQRRPGGLLNAR